jgi:hypothetical protein
MSAEDFVKNLLTESVEDKAARQINTQLGGNTDGIDYKLLADYLLKGSALGLGTALSLGLFKVLGGKHDIDP